MISLMTRPCFSVGNAIFQLNSTKDDRKNCAIQWQRLGTQFVGKGVFTLFLSTTFNLFAGVGRAAYRH